MTVSPNQIIIIIIILLFGSIVIILKLRWKEYFLEMQKWWLVSVFYSVVFYNSQLNKFFFFQMSLQLFESDFDELDRSTIDKDAISFIHDNEMVCKSLAAGAFPQIP